VDLDNSTVNMTGVIQYYDAAGTLITPALNLANVVGVGDGTISGPNGSYTATQDGDYYIRLTGGNATNYNLVLTIGNIHGGINEFGQFDYTLTENSVSNNATADIFNVAGNTIVGGEGDEIIIGGATNDILRGNGGNDVLQGNAGTDNLQGGTGADRLEGGTGNDTLDGGIGNDILFGGANNDLLTGGAGSDSFVWKLADKGTLGAPASDTITDFSTVAGVDKLDLRDLLVGEVAAGPTANLENYLHFDTVAGGSTIVHISNTGAYSSGFNAANDVQTITLQGYDVSSFAGDQAAIIADLITKQKLITD
jgi:large repetitive protein